MDDKRRSIGNEIGLIYLEGESCGKTLAARKRMSENNSSIDRKGLRGLYSRNCLFDFDGIALCFHNLI